MFGGESAAKAGEGEESASAARTVERKRVGFFIEMNIVRQIIGRAKPIFGAFT